MFFKRLICLLLCLGSLVGVAAAAEVEGAFLADAPEDTGDDCDIHAVILLQM